MADELWIVSDAELAGWTVDAEGKTDTNKEYNLDAPRVSIAVPDAPLTEKQAKAIRKLIVKLRKDGVLHHNPKVGVLYPQKTTVDNVTQSMPYLHCWQDDCDEELHTFADAGVSEGLPWVGPTPVEPPDQSVHQDPHAEAVEFAATRGRRKARDEDALYDRDDTPPEPAAGVPEAPLSTDPVEGDSDDVSGQVVLSFGSAGTEVEAWQAVCNEVLSMPEHADIDELLLTDGDFGPKTVKVTRLIQRILGVPMTGTVDGDTWVAVI